MTTSYSPSRVSEFTSTGLSFRGTGISFTATAGTTTTFDYLISYDKVLTGGFTILKNHAFGDSVKIQIVDVDGVVYPSGTVVGEFFTDWYFAEDTQLQRGADLPYPAKIIQGLYIRCVYNSVGTSDVSICVNLMMHKIL